MLARLTNSLWTLLCVSAAALSMSLPEARADGGDDPDRWYREIRVAPGLAISDHLIDVVTPFLRDHPESLEGNAGMDVAVRRNGPGFRIEIVKSGYLDDSVSGQHWRGFVIQTDDGQWELLSMKVKDLCARGRGTDGLCK